MICGTARQSHQRDGQRESDARPLSHGPASLAQRREPPRRTATEPRGFGSTGQNAGVPALRSSGTTPRVLFGMQR
jgi:hypothetical protein